MEIVYFGKKNPKIVEIECDGKKKSYTFQPFKVVKIADDDGDFAGKLLLSAGDIFKRVDTDGRAPDPKPVVKGEGYVGDVSVDQLEKPLKEVVTKEAKAEEGMDADEAIAKEIEARKANKAKKAGK
jgi:hypothetical protein